ncbi:effector-associated domain EAD1-containing protein, partial [Moorena sp. SIO3I6]|uniref:effector-associated domain EAD1-containing protein n=1 Tax=Moorena sp. SIO3I6 TaxID=2607831 RepID=UPI0013FC7579
MQNTGGIHPKYKNYERQKCFIGHSLGAEWCADLQSACDEILPKFNLEPWYAADQFTPTQTLREKVVELIANSRFGIYDISSWEDRDGNWQLPRNVYLELGIAIALNRPTLLLRHTSNQELQLPKCLQSIKILDFAGIVTLKKALDAQLPQWIDVPPDRDWLNRFCIFGNQVCSFRDKHPWEQKWGQEKITCHISDGFDKNHPRYHQSECEEIRGVFENIFNRYSNLTFNYLDELSLVDGYQYLLCSHCQTVRSTPFALYRILPNTSAETFIAIGMSLALDKLFESNIPRVILVKSERDLPSLLRGYDVVEACNSKEIKQKLKERLPKILNMVRETTWKPRPLPFIDNLVDTTSEDEQEQIVNTDTNYLNSERFVYVDNLSYEITKEDIVEVWSEYGQVVKVNLNTDSNTAKALVEMAEIDQATASIENLDEAEWMGRVIKVRHPTAEDISRFQLNTKSQDEPDGNDNELSSAINRLSGQELKELNYAICSAFPSKTNLDMMVIYGLNINLNTIASGDNLREIVFNLIQWAESTGNLEKLVKAACDENPHNRELQAVRKKIYPKVSDIAAEIQQLLEELEKSYPIDTTRGKIALATEVVQQIENNPTLRARVLRVGAVNAFEQLLSHPAASFVIGALEEWQ